MLTIHASLVYTDKVVERHARVVELADSLDSGSSVHYGRAGSSPASRTKKERYPLGYRSFFARGGVKKPPETGAPRGSPAERVPWGEEARRSE